MILNTNQISEPLRRESEARAVTWIDPRPVETLYFTVVGLYDSLDALQGALVA